MKELMNKFPNKNSLFLVTSPEVCWRCCTGQEVIALATYRFRASESGKMNDAEDEGEPFMLDNIVEMPDAIYQYIQKLHPQYRKHFSKTANMIYYANICCKCGANFGDFFLHMEPGGAFYPITEEQAAQMKIAKLPFDEVYDFDCSWSLGRWQFIADNAEKTA